jgi:hypothetical protein
MTIWRLMTFERFTSTCASTPAWCRAAVLLGLCAALAACGILGLGSDDPTSARVVVTAVGTDAIELVTSQSFAVDAQSGSIQAVAEADTFVVVSSFEQTFALSKPVRFFAVLTNFEEGNSVSMQVLLDETLRYDAQRALSVGEKLRFVFTAIDLSQN